MSDCPCCGAEGYTRSEGCYECGHYDEDLADERRRSRNRRSRRRL